MAQAGVGLEPFRMEKSPAFSFFVNNYEAAKLGQN
jgi:hypothetical protein